MLRIVEAATNKVLFAVDAWYTDCFERAQSFATAHDWIVIRKEITIMGDMVWWVA